MCVFVWHPRMLTTCATFNRKSEQIDLTRKSNRDMQRADKVHSEIWVSHNIVIPTQTKHVCFCLASQNVDYMCYFQQEI
jgi:hypothetical protein